MQFIEQDESESIIVAATNNQRLLDQALFRRFDDVLHYSMPSREDVQRLFELRIGAFDRNFIVSGQLLDKASSLSHAEIIRVCDDAIKISILENSSVNESTLSKLIFDRIAAYSSKEA